MSVQVLVHLKSRTFCDTYFLLQLNGLVELHCADGLLLQAAWAQGPGWVAAALPGSHLHDSLASGVQSMYLGAASLCRGGLLFKAWAHW